MLTDEGTTGSVRYTCFKMFNTTTQSLLAVVSFLPWRVWKFPENLEKALFCKVPTMHVGHLPVGNIHLFVIPQGQWKCDSISSSKDPWDVGLHHLQGGTEVGISGVCTLHEQKL